MWKGCECGLGWRCGREHRRELGIQSRFGPPERGGVGPCTPVRVGHVHYPLWQGVVYAAPSLPGCLVNPTPLGRPGPVKALDVDMDGAEYEVAATAEVALCHRPPPLLCDPSVNPAGLRPITSARSS